MREEVISESTSVQTPVWVLYVDPALSRRFQRSADHLSIAGDHQTLNIVDMATSNPVLLIRLVLRLMVLGCCLVSAVTEVNFNGNVWRASTAAPFYRARVKHQSRAGYSMRQIRSKDSSIQPLFSNGSTTASSQARNSEDPEPLWEAGRLPTSARPVRCQYILQPDLLKLELKGRAIFEVRVIETTSSVVFNGRRVKIDELRLFQKGMEQTILATEKNVVHIPERDQISVQSSQTLKPDTIVILNMKFRSNITTEVLEGVSITNYTAVRKEQRTPVLSTQIDLAFARRVFPCWDEPSFRTQFKLSIIRPAEFFAVSNTPLLRTTVVDRNLRLERDDFVETYPMSMYNLAFVLAFKSGYSFIQEAGRYLRPKLRVYAPLEQLGQGRLALDAARGIIGYLHKFYQIPFAIPKLDLIQLPKHSFGSSDHVGLHTFDAAVFLADETDSGEKDKEDVLVAVANGISSEWIGNWATFSWWTDLWTTAGPSQVLHSLAVDAIRPDWGMIDLMYYDLNYPGLKADGSPSTRPVSPPEKTLERPLDVLKILDQITYSKAGAIFRMISSEDFFGFDLLKKGLTGLMRRFIFRNFNGTDMIGELAKHASIGEDAFKKFMQTWIYQEGYPYLRVTLVGSTLTLQQRQYRTTSCTAQSSLGTNTATPTSNDAQGVACTDHVWHILVTCTVNYQNGKSEIIKVWVKTADPVSVTLTGGAVHFIQCNRQGRGYYRIRYSTNLLEALVQVLKQQPSKLHCLDRASLISDYKAFTDLKDDPVTPGTYNDVIKATLSQETELVVWAVALDDIEETYDSLEEKTAKENYRLLILNLIDSIYREVGWTDTGDHQRRQLRESILRYAVQYNQTDALMVSSRLFASWKSSDGRGVTLSPNIRSAVFMGGIKAFGQQAIDFLVVAYTRTTSRHFKTFIVKAVSRAAGSEELEKFMKRTMELSQAPDVAEMGSLLENAAYNTGSSYVATRFMCDHWNQLYGRLDSKALGRAVQQLIASCGNPEDLSNVKEFFRTLKPEKMDKVRGYVERGFEMAQLKNSWWTTHGDGMQQYMQTARGV